MTVRQWAAKWIDKRRGRVHTVNDEETRLRLHVLPTLGGLALDEVKARHVREVVDTLRQGKLAPRSVRHCYGTLRTMMQAAVRDELISSNPCVLGREELPRKQDKDPAWRATAVFTRREVETIISDERVPLDRRVLYALLFLTGCRFGEVAALRWRAYDRTLAPLGRFSVHASYDVKTDLEKEVKTGTPRLVPVHPTLAKVLAEWKLAGWESYVGRPPGDDDLILPSRTNDHRRVTHGRTKFHEDLDRLGLRRMPASLAAHVHLAGLGRWRAQGHPALGHPRPRGRHRGPLHDAAVGHAVRRGRQAEGRAARGQGGRAAASGPDVEGGPRDPCYRVATALPRD